MQEEVEQKVVTLIVDCTKLTEQELRKALGKLLEQMKSGKQSKQPHGKMTVKQLAAQNKGLQSIEVSDKNIGSFNKIARKYTQTDYSRNKRDSNAIVYCDAFGQTIRLTKDDFESEEEFLKWKDFSDRNYHEEENGDHLYRDRKLAIHIVAERRMAIPATEDLMMEYITEMERQQLRELLMQGYRECLTEIQQRRLWMYCVDGLDECEIAGIEGVGQPRICNSITDAKNKLKKFLKRGG